MRSDFDLLCEAEGKKDAELSREIFRKYLSGREAELAVLRDAHGVRAPEAVAKSVSYKPAKAKSKHATGIKPPKKNVKTLSFENGLQKLGAWKDQKPSPGKAANE